MRTLPIYKTWIQKAEPLKPIRLTQATLETLAIVAYRQPVTRAEVEHLRGVDGSSGLRTLLEHKLIRIMGKDSGPGRAPNYRPGRFWRSGQRVLALVTSIRLFVREKPHVIRFEVQAPAGEVQAPAGR